MAISINSVFLGGNLTRDPELRYTPSGAAVCNFDLAINRRYSGGDGTQREETVFIRVATFGRQAETCHEYLKKGSPALVEGWLTQSSWETEGGDKRTRIEVRARRVQFLSGGSSGGGGRNVSSSADDSYDREPERIPEDDVPF